MARNALEEILNEDLPPVGETPVAGTAAEWLSATTTKELVKSLYKTEYNTAFEMTPTQNLIFDAIFMKGTNVGKKRLHVMTHTQFGKSDVVSMAVLTRVATFSEKWALIAPSQPKAKIIMGYLIRHIFENEYTEARFKMEPGESADFIRRERSKSRLTFDLGDGKIGEVFILSGESRLKKGEDVGNALMGFGAPNVVMDEAALIGDEADAKAMRMVGGFTAPGMDFVVKVGNPFTRGHFLKAYGDEAYFKINADYKVGLKEGRLTQEFINEMREKPYFGVLYDNKFPSDTDIDVHGWTQLLSEDDVERAMQKEGEEIKHVGEKRIGNDVARGGENDTVWILRSMNYMNILGISKQDNLTEIASRTLFFMGENSVIDENVFIDDVGVGGGAVDPLLAQNKRVRGVSMSSSALDMSRFANLRAEAYWRLREWIKKGGRLSRDDHWFQLCTVKYKPDSKGRLRVMSKDDMRAVGIDSPDVADAGVLTFVRKEHADLEELKRRREAKKRKRVQGRGLKVRMGGY